MKEIVECWGGDKSYDFAFAWIQTALFLAVTD